MAPKGDDHQYCAGRFCSYLLFGVSPALASLVSGAGSVNFLRKSGDRDNLCVVGFPTLCPRLFCGLVVCAVDGEGFTPASLKCSEPASISDNHGHTYHWDCVTMIIRSPSAPVGYSR
jgi:hypothetical protein